MLSQAYLDQPREVSLETLALCNAACEFCPYPTIERKGARMSDALITRLVGEMAQFPRPFYFSPLSRKALDDRSPCSRCTY